MSVRLRRYELPHKTQELYCLSISVGKTFMTRQELEELARRSLELLGCAGFAKAEPGVGDMVPVLGPPERVY